MEQKQAAEDECRFDSVVENFSSTTSSADFLRRVRASPLTFLFKIVYVNVN